MRISKLVAAAALIGGLTISFSAWAPPGGNDKGKKGGQGGGDSALRLCADFADQPAPYINSDGNVSAITPFQYCDGHDGEILTDEGLKLSTTTRNTADRTVRVNFNSAYCTTVLNPVNDPLVVSGEELDAFFGWQNTEFAPSASCGPGEPNDPFATGFDVNSLECLESTGNRLPVQDLTVADGTKYQAWRVNLTHPTISLKKGGTALIMVFGGAFGSNQCPSDDGGLPMAIQCTAMDGEGADAKCESWHVKTFRACVFDYNTDRGGNWNAAYQGCPINTDITFTVKP